MKSILGEFEATLDSKGRFILPAGFKKQIPEAETGRYVIGRGFEKCLALYLEKNWDSEYEQIEKSNQYDPNARLFVRYFLRGASIVVPDSAGRLLITQSLKEYAELQKDIVLVAGVNKIEIWDSNKFKQLFESFSPETYSNLAKVVMVRDNDKLKS